jgi:hypothetical protein
MTDGARADAKALPDRADLRTVRCDHRRRPVGISQELLNHLNVPVRPHAAAGYLHAPACEQIGARVPGGQARRGGHPLDNRGLDRLAFEPFWRSGALWPASAADKNRHEPTVIRTRLRQVVPADGIG